MRISDWSSDVCSSDLALEHHASALILVHNHPSGDPKPSRDDIQMTRTILDAARLLGIAVRDHVIIGRSGHASRSEEHTSELQSLMRISYAVFCLKKKKIINSIPLSLTLATTTN